ncbi:MAG: 3-keto-disaccharide hydrolase [Gemmataceae bacterium]
MRRLLPLVLLGPLLFAAEGEKPDALTPEEAAKGWLLLFDGETTFGWKIDGEAKVEKGVLILGGTKPTTAVVTTSFPHCRVNVELEVQGKGAVTPVVAGVFTTVEGRTASLSELSTEGSSPSVPLAISVPAETRVLVRKARVLPLAQTPLFNGIDLTGWKQFKGDPKREKSKFTVADGVLTVKDGPGDLATQKLLDDFVLQFECKSNGKHLNSGVFFRAIPDQYQNGYEAQIQHDFTLETPKKYLVDEKSGGKREVLSRARDFGTGAIYRRVPARKAAAKDGEWFTMTVVARGRHVATWVNGVQQVDWTDGRPPHDNPRNGYREKAGAVSIQGHDPTTDLSFRNLRYAPLK